jgi:hypothetical protein
VAALGSFGAMSAPTAAPTGAASLRCAAVTREAGVDPIGSAGAYSGYLLIEWPLPWPRDLSEIPELSPVLEALAGTGLRLQGLVSSAGATEGRRVIRYTRRRDEPFHGFERTERLVPVEQVAQAAVELARGGDGDAASASTGVTHDVLVCTHGKRDVCCGSSGTALALALADGPARLDSSVRLWRTSHTGGHRFAPTGIVLPQGTVWAFLDADAVGRIVARRGPLDDLLPRYRGSAGLDSAAIQAVEREAFRDVGWDWLDWHRHGSVLDDGRVTVTGTSASGEHGTWTATVEIARQVAVPECGLPIDAAKKSEPELVVRSIDRSGP